MAGQPQPLDTTPLLLPDAEVVRYAAAAGFTGDSLVTAVAIALAETGGTLNAHGIGDKDLSEPGEMSVGLWQINYRPSRDKKETTRHPSYTIDPGNNAASAYAISNGGRDFGPWSTYDASTKHPRNNGAYRKYLAQAKNAVAGTPGGAQDYTSTPDDAAPSIPVLGGFTDAVGPALPLRIGGSLAWGELGAGLIGGSIDLTTNEVSEVQVEIEDPDLMLTTRYRLNIHSPVDLYDIRWQVVEFQLAQGPANPHATLICHPLGAVKMRTGSSSDARKISPTDYMSTVAKAAGLRFVGEPSGPRDSIGPATKKETQNGVTVERPETAWEVGNRLAAELGFRAFEAGGTYFFGSTAYLIEQGRRVQLAYKGFSYGPTAGPVMDMLGFPSCRAATRRYIKAGTVVQGTTPDDQGQTHTITYLGDMDALDEVTVTARLERTAETEKLRPAMRAAVAGVGPFNNVALMVTKVSWSLADLNSPVDITVATVSDAAPTARTTADDAAKTSGHGSSLDFVTHALRQVGDAYITEGPGVKSGASEVSLTDPDPTHFDCSELVQWACAQVGVKIADGSGNQKAACKSISVAQAAKTRGALLFRPGHVAISLGDGKNTVEAKGRKYGVVSGGKDGVVGNRFSSGGLIPGMTY